MDIIIVADSGVITQDPGRLHTLAMPITFQKVQTLIATPAVNALTLHVGTALTGQIDLGNLGGMPLTGITATASGAPANVTVTVTPPSPNQLAPMADAPATVSVLANNASIPTGTATLTFTSAEGQTTTATLNLTVVPPKPNLV